MICKKCTSTNLVKNGFNPKGKQKWLCRDCGYRGVEKPQLVGRPQQSKPDLNCVNCGSNKLVKNGVNAVGHQVWKCKYCGYRGVKQQQ